MDKLDKILAKLTDDEKRDLRSRIKFKRGPTSGANRKPKRALTAHQTFMAEVRRAARAVALLKANALVPGKFNVAQRVTDGWIGAEIDKSPSLGAMAQKQGPKNVIAAINFYIVNKPSRLRPPKWMMDQDAEPNLRKK